MFLLYLGGPSLILIFALSPMTLRWYDNPTGIHSTSSFHGNIGGPLMSPNRRIASEFLVVGPFNSLKQIDLVGCSVLDWSGQQSSENETGFSIWRLITFECGLHSSHPAASLDFILISPRAWYGEPRCVHVLVWQWPLSLVVLQGPCNLDHTRMNRPIPSTHQSSLGVLKLVHLNGPSTFAKKNYGIGADYVAIEW